MPSRSAMRAYATSTGTSSHTDQSQRPRSSGRCRKIPSTMSTASRGAVTHADSTGASRATSNAASWNPVVAAGLRARRGTGRSAPGGRSRSRTSRGRSPRATGARARTARRAGGGSRRCDARNTAEPSSAKTSARRVGEDGLARAVDAVDGEDHPAAAVVLAHLVAQFAPQGGGGGDRAGACLQPTARASASSRAGRRRCALP